MNSPWIRLYFIQKSRDLKKYSSDGKPWFFLLASTYLEYLAKCTFNTDIGKRGKGYKKFIREYLSKTNAKYRNFKFTVQNKSDLPDQMYHILRCGIVHSFSLIPDIKTSGQVGRSRSIVLCHKKEADRLGLNHLDNYHTKMIPDAAVFIAEDFANDLYKITKILFSDSRHQQNIKHWVEEHPPITGGF